MPTSHFTQIPQVIEAVIDVNPDSILEIGIGCGKWSILCREYLEVWDRYFNAWGERKIVMDGIEIHDLYSDSPGWIGYNAVHIGDATEIVPTLGHYDLIMLIDVLEHFEFSDGFALLQSCLDKSDAVLVAIPSVYFPTVEVWDNPHEIHKCAWAIADFELLGAVNVYRNADSLVVTVRREQ